MTKLLAALAAGLFLVAAPAFAADAPKSADTKAAATKLEKPANVSAEAWAKMTDAEKRKAVDDAHKSGNMKAATKEATPKKEKKGGC